MKRAPMHLSNPGSSHIARSWTARLAAIGAIVAGASAVTACGGGASTSSTTLLQLRADSYNTLVPAQAAGTTTSTIAALPGQRTGEQSYTVQSGDGLMKIANIYSVTAEAIAAANGWVDGTVHPIFPGDIIKIPAGGIVPYPTTTTTEPPPTTQPACIADTYTVVSGDSPSRVASKFGVTRAALDAANKSTKGYKNFVVGIEINIPCKE